MTSDKPYLSWLEKLVTVVVIFLLITIVFFASAFLGFGPGLPDTHFGWILFVFVCGPVALIFSGGFSINDISSVIQKITKIKSKSTVESLALLATIIVIALWITLYVLVLKPILNL